MNSLKIKKNENGKTIKAKHDYYGNLINDASDINASKTEASWLSSSVMEGQAGETKVTFTAAASVGGTIQGENGTGGIAGRNLGVLLKCENTAGINLSEQENTVDLEALASGDALAQLADSGEEDDLSILNSHTDTGGVAGYSSGVIQSPGGSGEVEG